MKPEFPSKSTLQAYVNGELSPEQSHEIERLALQDPLLQDAIDGLESREAWDVVDRVDASLPQASGWSASSGLWIVFAMGLVAMTYFVLRPTDEPAPAKTQEVQTATVEISEPVSENPKAIVTSNYSDSSIAFTTVEETHKHIAKAKEAFTQITTIKSKLELPENLHEIPIEDIVEEDLDLTPKERNRISGNAIYHIESYKVVDYRELRKSALTVSSLVHEGGLSAAYESEADRENEEPSTKDVAYVDYLEGAMKNFAKGKFRKAAEMYDIILETYPDDTNAIFYGGMCAYYQRKYDQAITHFETEVSGNLLTFEQETEYYLGLSLIENGDEQKACEVLRQVIQRQDFYAKQALEIVQKNCP